MVVPEQVSFLLDGGPVDVNLVGKLGLVGVVGLCADNYAAFGEPAGGNEHASDVVPTEPGREPTFTVVQPVGQMLIDLDHAEVDVAVCLLGKADSVGRELAENIRVYMFRQSGDAVETAAHGIADLLEIAFQLSTEDTEVAHDAAAFLFVQEVKDFSLRGFVLIVKDALGDAGQIAELGDDVMWLCICLMKS